MAEQERPPRQPITREQLQAYMDEGIGFSAMAKIIGWSRKALSHKARAWGLVSKNAEFERQRQRSVDAYKRSKEIKPEVSPVEVNEPPDDTSVPIATSSEAMRRFYEETGGYGQHDIVETRPEKASRRTPAALDGSIMDITLERNRRRPGTNPTAPAAIIRPSRSAKS